MRVYSPELLDSVMAANPGCLVTVAPGGAISVERPGKEPEFNNPPWIPVTDPFQIAMLGKLSEEMHELGKVVARTLMQGIEGKDPKTGDVNSDELEKEIADLRAMLLIVEAKYYLRPLDDRMFEKVTQKLVWLNGLRPDEPLTLEMILKRGGL